MQQLLSKASYVPDDAHSSYLNYYDVHSVRLASVALPLPHTHTQKENHSKWNWLYFTFCSFEHSKRTIYVTVSHPRQLKKQGIL